jgi:aspartyl aminopeptidase
LNVNKETHLAPILGTAGILMDGVKKQLTGNSGEESDTWREHQDPLLLELIAKELSVEVKDIADFELNLFDTQPACIGGMKDEFVYSARLDNQATCFVSIEGLIDYTNNAAFENDVDISMVCLFDHEEVGSCKLLHLAKMKYL